MSEQRTVLVTGGAGFIGSHLVKAYLDRGDRVVIVDDLSTGKRENLDSRADFREMSITNPRLDEVFREVRPALVNHHAAQASVRRSVEDPAEDARINIIGSLKLLEVARRRGVKKVLFASTGGAIYGEQDYFPADEKHPKRPVSPYGAAKSAVETYLGYYHVQYGLEYTALRYANVYGPRQDPHGEAGVVAIFSGRLIGGQAPVINGDGGQTRDYVYVGDVVAANLAAGDSDFIGAVNIGTGIETSVTELSERMIEVVGSNVEPEFAPAKAGEQRRSVLDASMATDVLGWRPATALPDGLRETIDFFRRESERTG